MKLLITGAGGFMGPYVARHAIRSGDRVLGIGRNPPEVWPSADFELCDVRDADRVATLIAAFRPDRIFHLAARSNPPASLLRPRETMDINVNGTINVFEAVRAAGILPVVVVACSSAEYGRVPSEEMPVRETHVLNPLHPYGVSKVAQDLLAAQYFANYGIPTVRIRIFNTTGPGKRGDVCADMTRRVVEIERGLRPPSLTVGSLTNRRAICDVRDFVRALALAAEYAEPGEVYNISADDTYTVQDLIDAIRDQAQVSFSLVQDPALLRPADEKIIAGSNAKLRTRLVWWPEIPMATTLRDMLNWWRERLSRESVVPVAVAAAPA